MSNSRLPQHKGFPPYDINLPRRVRWKLEWLAWCRRRKFDPESYWQTVPTDEGPFREFVRDQVLYYSPALFDSVRVEADSSVIDWFKKNKPLVIATIHHGFFPIVLFVINKKFGIRCTTVGTSPRRNLSPEVNPDHEIWKFAFYYQTKRFLGERIIFSDEAPRIAIDWLSGGGSLVVPIDASEAGVRRKTRRVRISNHLLDLPETATRLALLARCPLIGASIYYREGAPVLTLTQLYTLQDKSDADHVFQRICEALFEPLIRYPNQSFFDILSTFQAK